MSYVASITEAVPEPSLPAFSRGNNESFRLQQQGAPRRRTDSVAEKLDASGGHTITPRPRVNRWVALLLTSFVDAVCGTHMYNWTPWEAVLRREGLFRSGCPVDITLSCDSQASAIASILPTVTLCMFTLTFVSGFLLDLSGPLTCSVLGSVLSIVGYSFLALYKRSETFVRTGFAIMGAGVDAIYFGTLCVANLFPGHQASIIAILGGCRSLSTALPVLFKALVESKSLDVRLSTIAWFMVGICTSTLFIAIAVIPAAPFRILKIAEQPSPIATPGNADDWNPGSETHNSPYVSGLSHVAMAQTSAATGNVIRTSRSVRVKSRRVKAALSGFAVNKFSLLMDQLKETASLVPSNFYWPLLLCCIVNILRNNWLLTSASKQFSSGAVSLLELLNIIAFIVGPIMGYIVDIYGPVVGLFILQVTNLIMLLFMLFSQLAKTWTATNLLGYLAVVAAFPGVGFINGQIFCYVAVIFPPTCMGKLVGLALFVSGLVSLTTTPTFDWALLQNKFWAMDLIHVIITVLTMALVIFLWTLGVPKFRAKSHPTTPSPGAPQASDLMLSSRKPSLTPVTSSPRPKDANVLIQTSEDDNVSSTASAHSSAV